MKKKTGFKWSQATEPGLVYLRVVCNNKTGGFMFKPLSDNKNKITHFFSLQGEGIDFKFQKNWRYRVKIISSVLDPCAKTGKGYKVVNTTVKLA